MAKHLVWDWNGTLLNDLDLVVAATNAAFASVGGPVVTAEEHRRDYRRPIVDYYAYVLGRPVAEDEFVRLDDVFHRAYREKLVDCALADDALDAIHAWEGTQSLLSMWFHDELVPEVTRRGLVHRLARVDGLRAAVGGGHKAEHLATHLAELGVDGPDAVLIGDSVDDANAAHQVGAAVVLYAGGFTDPPLLEATGLPVASSLLEAVQLAVAPTGTGRSTGGT
ncbi:phosphatase [Virgisporangium aliadipatigenens]|uniref:Phosphatase n=1 Tax=Virgisporangium aliadipatigenens TaxID=741659 RepID=A0A8J3YNR1_9ACTN|nr:HAD hydrolase-like protein [Virgisporangium aliadipatigenens]GIJ48571.1 phosphatase [Virgisporangium aliadipatigenens]